MKNTKTKTTPQKGSPKPISKIAANKIKIIHDAFVESLEKNQAGQY